MRRRKFEEKAVMIERLTHEGRGIASYKDKTAMVRYALPGEEVDFKPSRYRAKVYEGIAKNIRNPSPDRIEPRCEHFGVCGGCDLQHVSTSFQHQLKEKTVREQLQHFGQIDYQEPISWIESEPFGYRHKARLGVRYVPAKEKVVVGFREALSHFVTNANHCPILATPENFLTTLQDALSTLSIKAAIPQIEMAVSDEGITLLVRHLETPTLDDRQLLLDYANKYEVHVWLQPGGYDTASPMSSSMPEILSYQLPEFDVTLQFSPDDFTQINMPMNQKMLSQAVQWLDITPGERILDLFCGIGNFSLPMAKKGAQVVGVEWCEKMVKKAKDNADRNAIQADFFAHDLTKPCQDESWFSQGFNKLLLDPPRSGAKEVIEQLRSTNFDKIVYVSCNSATFAHDAGILVNEQGYSLSRLSLMDMFPHTKHVEVMAVFDK